MESRKGEFLLNGLTICHLRSLLQQSAQLLGAALQVAFTVTDKFHHLIAPGILAFSYFFDEIYAGAGHETGRILKEFRFEKGEFEDVLSKMGVFGFKSCNFSERFIEFEGRVDDKIKPEDSEHVSFGVE